MGDNQIQLDHIAIYVTNLERSMRFYQDVLHMTVGEPLSLRDQSTGLKYTHSLISHGPKLVKDWISRAKPTAYQHMYTDICHCSAADGTINLILIQQTHPERGYTRSVDGNSLYGFSYQLSSEVSSDDLAWDLSIADVSFEHGDYGTDGTVFTQSGNPHSLYIRDPDGRMIELTSSESPDNEKTGFITRMGHVIIYVQDIQASTRFYKQMFGITDITPDYVPRDPWKKNITWLGLPGSLPVLLLYQVTNPDGTREKTGGYGLDHIALTGLARMPDNVSDPSCVTAHPPAKKRASEYLRDPDGYIIEVTG